MDRDERHALGRPPVYDRLNTILLDAKFDRFVEDRFERFYVKGKGRPGIAQGVYMRMMLVNYFEGITSERGIAWRCADSLHQRAEAREIADAPAR